LATALLVGGALIGYFGRYWSFFYDEWGTIFYRRSGGFSAFFAPHNGHLQAVVIVIYRALFATAGLRSYRPYQVVLIVSHLVLVGLVYSYGRERTGPWVALAFALPLLVLAYAWQVIFWTINLGFVLPLIVLVLALRWRHPAVIAVGLAVALASSGLGIAVALGLLVLVLCRPDRARLLAAWGLPVAAYAIWWFAYRPDALPPAGLRHIPGASPTGDIGFIRLPLSNLGHAPAFVLHLAKATADSLAGRHPAGWWMLGLLVLALGVGIAARRRTTPAMIALAVATLVFWVEVALSRAQYLPPESFGASRYLYPGAFLIVLLLFEVFAGLRPPLLVLGALFIAVAVIVASDIRMMDRFSGQLRTAFARQNALLRRAQCDPRLPRGLSLDPVQAPGVTVGPYLAAVQALGSPPGQSC
jgi:hypothetical protein